MVKKPKFKAGKKEYSLEIVKQGSMTTAILRHGPELFSGVSILSEPDIQDDRKGEALAIKRALIAVQSASEIRFDIRRRRYVDKEVKDGLHRWRKYQWELAKENTIT
jgi:hypothetical protein